MLNTAESEFVRAIAVRVRSLRMRRALSQEDLADRAGMSRSSVHNLESGRHLAHPSSLRKIARALNVTPTQLTSSE